jgi:hypothetical protein
VVSNSTSGATVVAISISGFDEVAAGGFAVFALVFGGLVVAAMVAGTVVAGTVVAGTVGLGPIVAGFVVAGFVVAFLFVGIFVVTGPVVTSGDAVVEAAGAAVVPIAHDEVHGLHRGTSQSSSSPIESHHSGHNENGICVVVAAEGRPVVAPSGSAVVITRPDAAVVIGAAVVIVSAVGPIVCPDIGEVVPKDSGGAVVVCSSTCGKLVDGANVVGAIS